MLDAQPTPYIMTLPEPLNGFLIAMFLAAIILFFVVLYAEILGMTPEYRKAMFEKGESKSRDSF